MSFDLFTGMNNLNIRTTVGSFYGKALSPPPPSSSSRSPGILYPTDTNESYYGKALSPPSSSSRSPGILYPTAINDYIPLHNPMFSNTPRLPRDHQANPYHHQDYRQTQVIPFAPAQTKTNNYNIPDAPFVLQPPPFSYNQAPHRTTSQFHDCPSCASPIIVQVAADQFQFHVNLSRANHDSLSNYPVEAMPEKQQLKMVTAPREEVTPSFFETNERSYASITVAKSNKPNSEEEQEEAAAKDDKTTNAQVDDDANGFTTVVSSKTKKKAKAEARAAAALEMKKMYNKQQWGNQRVEHNKQPQQHHRNDRHGRVAKDGHDIYSRDPKKTW